MSVWQMVRRLDAITGRALFVPLYQESVQSMDIGEFESELERLGITVANGEVQLPPGGTGWVRPG